MGESGGYNLRGLKTLIEYQVAGAAYRALPGPSAIRDPGLERDTETTSNFAGPSQSLGEERIGEITIDSKYMPHHKSWKDLRKAFEDGSIVGLRYTIPTAVVPTSQTARVAITSTGVVTFTDTGTPPVLDFKQPQYDVGLVIQVGSDFYVVDTINRATGAVMVTPPPGAAVAATAFSLRLPSIRRVPQCQVRKIDEMQIEGNAGITTQLILIPTSRLPEATLGDDAGIV